MRFRSCENEPTDRVDGPGLGGWDSSLLSESTEEIVRRLVLDLDWVDLDLRIWLCRRLNGGVGGRRCCERVRVRDSDDSAAIGFSEMPDESSPDDCATGFALDAPEGREAAFSADKELYERRLDDRDGGGSGIDPALGVRLIRLP